MPLPLARRRPGVRPARRDEDRVVVPQTDA